MNNFDDTSSIAVLDAHEDDTFQDEEILLDASALATQSEEDEYDDPDDPIEILTREYLETPEEAAEDEDGMPSSVTARMTARSFGAASTRAAAGSLRDRTSRRAVEAAPPLSKRARRHQMVAKLVVYVIPMILLLVTLVLMLDKYQVISLGIFSASETEDVEESAAPATRQKVKVEVSGDPRLIQIRDLQNDAEVAWSRDKHQDAVDKMQEAIDLYNTLIDEEPADSPKREQHANKQLKLLKKMNDWRRMMPVNGG